MPSKTQMNILLVDDELMVLELASEILSYLGHNVHLANSGSDGFRIFLEKKDELDLIIVDLLMPDMNGKEFYEKIRSVDRNIPIIISSGISEAKEKKALKKLEIFDVLEKPYTVPQLEEMLNKVRKLVK